MLNYTIMLSLLICAVILFYAIFRKAGLQRPTCIPWSADKRKAEFTGKRKFRPLLTVIAVLVAFSFAGCSFTEQHPYNLDTDEAENPSVDTTDHPDTSDPSPDNPESVPSYLMPMIPAPVKLAFGDDGINISAFEVSGDKNFIKIDDEHILVTTYTFDNIGNSCSYQNIYTYILNISTGKIVQLKKLEDGFIPATVVKKSENGVLINSLSASDGEIKYWEIKKEDDQFKISEVKYDEDQYKDSELSEAIKSPDGKTTVYNVGEKDSIKIKYQSGEERTVLEQHLTKPHDDFSGRGYVAVDFLDNDKFVYKIIGYEYIVGYGIYNVRTGETVEYENGYSVVSVYGGNVYSEKSGEYKVEAIGILDSGGVHREVPIPERYARLFEKTWDSPIFHEGKWYIFKSEDNQTVSSVYVFSDDLSIILSEINLPNDRYFDNAFLFGNTLTFIFGEKVEPIENVENDIYSVAEMLYLTSGEMKQKYGELPAGITLDYGDIHRDYIEENGFPKNDSLLPSSLKISLKDSMFEKTWGNKLNYIINPYAWEKVNVSSAGELCAEITLGDFTVEYRTWLSNLGDLFEKITDESSTETAKHLFVEYCSSNTIVADELTLRITEEKANELIAQKMVSNHIDNVSFLLDMTFEKIVEKYGELKCSVYYGGDNKAVLYEIESMPGVGLYYNTKNKSEKPDNGSFPTEVVIFGEYSNIFENNVLGMTAIGEWEKIGLADRYGYYRLTNSINTYVLSVYCDGAVGFNSSAEDSDTVLSRLETIRQNPTGYVSAITVSKADK